MMTRAPVSRSYSPGLVVQIDVTVVPFEGFRAIVDDMDACDCRCRSIWEYIDEIFNFFKSNDDDKYDG